VDRAYAAEGEKTSIELIASRVEEIKPHLKRESIETEAMHLEDRGALRSVNFTV
jgi:hypothetical protein